MYIQNFRRLRDSCKIPVINNFYLNCILKNLPTSNYVKEGVPRGVGGERWTCDPTVSGSSLSAGNLKKLLIWMKIHGLPQKS